MCRGSFRIILSFPIKILAHFPQERVRYKNPFYFFLNMFYAVNVYPHPCWANMPAIIDKTFSEEFVCKHSYIAQKLWPNLNVVRWLGKDVIQCLRTFSFLMRGSDEKLNYFRKNGVCFIRWQEVQPAKDSIWLWTHIWFGILLNCMTLEKLNNISMPWFPHLSNENE